jgi:hypothetical protein
VSTRGDREEWKRALRVKVETPTGFYGVGFQHIISFNYVLAVSGKGEETGVRRATRDKEQQA